ncbi:hypothetical protein BL254_09185 [Protofrankia sp. BMG5.30]|uniref:Major facilitator superfamily (MFS) profile domain-containing protein n=1 Tax=Protofrankia coriariae TaxID=1562887 RepID=A0ABR5F3A7_9ACTN|nr:hypothetical protein FrCorBMG51_12950 [Protofrankia coriariae]ONH35918.1 hypothetical protein BL254_09185 [Protofrankia sp. BMG5.30]
MSSIGVFVVFLDATIVNVAFESITRSFHTTTAGLAWVLNAYALVLTALLVLAGRLADQFGRKRLFQIGLIGFAVTSAACGLASGTAVLIAARALQAVFAAILVPSSLALLLPEFPPHKRSAAIGIWGAMGGLAAASGPVLGSVLVQYLSWRWVFLVNLPICLLAALVGARVLRESRDTGATGIPDPFGILFVTLALSAVAFGIIEGPDWGWDDPRVIGAFLVAAVGLPLFVVRTRHAARPAVDLSLFRVRAYSVANAGMLTFATAFFAVTLANIIFLQTVWHWSVLRSALAVTPSPLLAGVAAPLAGALADRFGHRAVLVPGALSFTAAMLLFATQIDATPHYVTDWLPAALLTGAGIGLTLPTLGSAAAASLPPARFGIGSAINSSFRQLGAVLGVSVFVAVLGTPSPASALDAFQRVWYVMAGVAALSALLCAAVRTRSHRPQAARQSQSAQQPQPA